VEDIRLQNGGRKVPAAWSPKSKVNRLRTTDKLRRKDNLSDNNIIIGIVLCLPFLLIVGGEIYQGEMFDINIGDHMQRAANANKIDLAKQEMQTVVTNMEKAGMTSGYTSVVYTSPDEDVGYWYQNMKEANTDLQSVDADNITRLEESNVLMKLRESLTDSSDGKSSIAVPEGISRFPNNKPWAYGFWGSLILAIGGYVVANKPY
jgi:hypothetical protein